MSGEDMRQKCPVCRLQGPLINIMHVSANRSRNSQELITAATKQREPDLLLISESRKAIINRKRGWKKDQLDSAAVYCLNPGLLKLSHRGRKGERGSVHKGI